MYELIRDYAQFLQSQCLDSCPWEAFYNPAHVGLFSLLNFLVDNVDDYLVVNVLERLQALFDTLTLWRLLLNFVSERITRGDELPLEVLGQSAGIFKTSTTRRTQEENSPH